MKSVIRENDENANSIVLPTKSGKQEILKPAQSIPPVDDDEIMEGQPLVRALRRPRKKLTLCENDENANATMTPTKSGKREILKPVQPIPPVDDDEDMEDRRLISTSSHRPNDTDEDEEVIPAESSRGFSVTSMRHKEFLTISAVDLQHMIGVSNSRRIAEQRRSLHNIRTYVTSA